MKKWLSLYPEVFMFVNNKILMFYNSNNKKFILVDRDESLNDMYISLQEPGNAYTYELTELFCENYKYLLNDIETNLMGKVVSESYDNRPLSYPPLLKLENDLTRIRYAYSQKKAGDILNYFRELTIYLSGDINKGYIHKQTIYPLSPSSLTIDDELMINFLKTIEFCPVNFINIVINSIDDINNHNSVFQYLIERKYNIRLFLKATLYLEIKELLYIFNESEIILLSSLDDYLRLYSHIKEGNVRFNILIESEDELCRVEDILIDNIEIIPVFNNNIKFFEKEVYNNIDEIIQCEKKGILAKTVINYNYYGKLTLFPSGDVYSNVNITPLGNFSEHIYELIYKELDGQRAWLLTRDAVEPCKNCLYKYLCPSISNYEYVCGKFNLCHMVQ